MNSLVRLLLSGYQVFLSPLLKQTLGIKGVCRYSPSCSTFAKTAIKKQGVLRGCCMAALRVLSCQPFSFSKNIAKV